VSKRDDRREKRKIREKQGKREERGERDERRKRKILVLCLVLC
jgi:hypothetical protein